MHVPSDSEVSKFRNHTRYVVEITCDKDILECDIPMHLTRLMKYVDTLEDAEYQLLVETEVPFLAAMCF